jgi:septal ring factor EnvC (AmiA/AmiB activator)
LEKQKALADESKALKKQLQAKDNEIAKLKQKIEQLNTNVKGAQKENQVLAAKLTAAKQVTAPPASTVKSNAIGRGIASVSASNQDWMLAAKETLYGDLTNLIIMGVKQEAEGKVFECLQTGTNGSESPPPPLLR